MNFEQQLEKVAIKKTNLFKTILLFIGLMGAWSVKAQNVTLNMRNVPIQHVLKQVSRQTGISILYDEKYFVDQSKISIEVQDVSYKDVLDRSLEKTNLYYEFIDEAVVIRRKKNEKESTKQSLIDIKGVVMDDSGKPISGVSISFQKNKQAGVGTSEDGFFSIKAEIEDVIVFSKVGYETFETNVDGNKFVYNVKLQTKSIAIEDVVVTGLVTRKAESFTGSALTITKEQLFNGGNMNVLQSIKNIDPSFRFADNLDMGSNPNQLPEINLRGKSSMPDLTGTYTGNPNQPLFILDGFETTLQRVYDLDMNRVKSVTLLKDAAAAAIYGAKAGNGVVVIETIPPASGKLRLSYNGNLNIEAPDLTGYNLMNAQQKLDWEKNHNMYYSVNPELNTMRQNLYNQLYQDVYMKGVDTYWLSKPLQVGIGQRHSVIIDGGDDYVRYSVNLMQNTITGAMKESGRNTFSGNSTLSYRHKNLIFTNALTITHNNAKNSPYGEFSDYVKLNPYWTATNETGALKMLLGYYPTSVGSGGLNPTYNPLYNAQLGGVNGSKYQEVIENFYAEWRVLNNLRLKGGLQYMYQKEEQNKFTPPGHTDYINYTVADGTDEYRGLWTRSLGGNQSFESNVGADYSVTAGKHFVMSNITFNINENKNSSTLIAAEGFASNDAADISLGANYQRGSSPSGSDGLSRTLGIMAMTNYAYDNRFLFDGSYRTSASSLYGSNSRWEGFWSLGTGWNLHNEPFVKNLNIFQQLRLRGSIGSTGSQNASSFLTAATYNYRSIVYNGKKGVTLLGIPNPDLQWQRQTTYNFGADVTIFKSKLMLRYDLYQRVTTNLLQEVTAPPSIGASTYRINLGGSINQGQEFSVRYQAFNDAATRSYLNFAVAASKNKNWLHKLSNAFRSYNDEQDRLAAQGTGLIKPTVKYVEGQSLTPIWAVRSLGIDPVTGQEIYLTADGNQTFTWSARDQVVVGDTEPKLNGNFNVNGGYKGFTMSLTCTFRFGGQLYNSTIPQRVEDIDGRSNLDLRILDAWSQIGDNAIYRKPNVGSTNMDPWTTRPTTRFLQDNNELYFSSVNIGYAVQNREFLKKIGLDQLRGTFYTNELLRISSIQIERGLSYPFARNFSFSLQASF